MKRILHWNESWRPLIGGTEVLLQHLTAEQLRRGAAVAALTDHAHAQLAPRENLHGVTVHRLPLKRALLSGQPAELRAAAAAVRRVIDEFRPELIHLHLNGPSVWFALLAGLERVAPLVVTLHTPFRELAVPAAMVARVLDRAAAVIAVSQALAAEVLARHPAVQPRLQVIWNALPAPPRPLAALPHDPPVVLAAGRLAPEKGFDTALQAFAQIRKHFPAARLVVAGDGPERAALEQLARESLPSGSTLFLGWVEPAEMTAVIDAATLVLMPSLWQEPFGLVALQAALRARPIVASAVGGLPEIVAEGVTGRLVPPDDVDAFAGAARALLGDRAALQRMGEAAAARAAARFSLAACADAYAAAYARVAAPG